MLPFNLPFKRCNRAFVAVLAVVVVAEAVAMWLVGILFPDFGPIGWREILLDALVVVVLSGPFVWRLAVRPLEMGMRGGQRFAQTLFDNSGALVVVLDRAGRIVRFNPGCELAAGYTAAEVAGRYLFELLIPENDRAKVREYFAQCVDGSAFPRHFQNEWMNRDGGRRWIAWTNEVLRDEAGRIEYIVASGLDMTEQRRQEQQRHQSETWLRALIEATNQSTVLMAMDGTVLTVNTAAASRLGGTPESIVGRNLYAMLPPQLAEAQRRRFDQVAVDGRPVTFEDERDGMRCRLSVVPIKDAAGAVIQAAIFSEDITEARLLQRIDMLLASLDQQVLDGRSLDDILDFACRNLSEVLGYEAVWVGRRMDGGRVDLLFATGSAGGYVEAIRQLGVRWDDTPTGRGVTGATIRSGRVQTFNADDADLAPWAETATRFGLRSALGLPLIIRDQVFGALVLYSSNVAAFSDANTLERLRHIGARLNVVVEAADKQQQMKLLRLAVDTAGSGIMVTHHDGVIEWTNRALRQMFGFTEAELVGATPRLFKSGLQGSDYYRNLWETLTRGDTWRGETINKRKDGSLLTIMQIVAPVRGIGGEISHYISVMEDISLRKAAEDRNRHLAEHDALTDLPNRAVMQARLERLLTGEKRRRHALVSLLFLDIDNFKQINDNFGHDVGDALLCSFGKLLRGVVRAEDTVARIGGDEFVVLLPGLQAAADAEIVARNILASLESPIDCLGTVLRVGSSIGIAHAPAHATDPAVLLKCADIAMYAAKQAGRNTYRIFDSVMAAAA